MRILDFELVDLGIEHEQYFGGFGCSHTSYSESCYGIGDDPAEALEDCLEQIAQSGFDTAEMESRISKEFPDFSDDKKNSAASVTALEESERGWSSEDDKSCNDELDPDFSDHYYHIGIRWNCVNIPSFDCDHLADVQAFANLQSDSMPSGLTLQEFGILREYAIWKARAMECRLSGNIARALEYESDCDRLYAKLPPDLKW